MNTEITISNKRDNSRVVTKAIDWKLVVYLFLVIFSPPIIPNLNIIIPVTVYSLISLTFNYKHTLLKVLKNSIIIQFIKIYILCYGTTFFLMYMNIVINKELFINNFATNIYRMFILTGALLVCIIYFLVRAEALGYKFNDVIRIFVYSFLLQVGIALLAFFIPSVKSFLLTVMENNTGSDVFYREGLFSYGYTYRYNGFAGTLLDTFGYGMGLAASVIAVIGFYKSKKYLLWALLLLIPSVLNSRTGLLIAAIGFVIAFIFSLFKSTPQKVLKQLGGFLVILLVVGVIFYITAINSPSTVGWILDGFESIFDFLTGQEVRAFSTADKLFSDDFWALPETARGLLFGEGFRLYGMSEILGIASDVGYINHIWLAGVIGMVLMYIPFLYLFVSISLSKKYPFSNAIAAVLTISYFVMLIKGDIIGYNVGMFVNIFMAFTLTYDYSKNINENNLSIKKEGSYEQNFNNYSAL